MSEDSIDWIMENFQPKELCSQIKIMKAFEKDTNYKLKTLEKNDTEDTMEKTLRPRIETLSREERSLSC